jgi:hypothetical protein
MPAEILADVLAVERERLFSQGNGSVGRATAIDEPGAYLTYEIAGQPIIVLRDRAGQVRAFSMCVCTGCRCCYRPRTDVGDRLPVSRLELQPRWIAARGAAHGAHGFCKDDYRLPELRTEIWLGWIYVTSSSILTSHPLRSDWRI